MKLFSSSIILCAVALLFMKSLSTSISEHCNLEFSYGRPLSLFILFTAIAVSEIVGRHKQSTDEFDGVFTYFCSLSEVGASFDNTEEECSDVDVYEDTTGSSDGYYEDNDDDDNNDTDDSWYGEEEYGDDLKRRIEDFIAKVNDGWREERLKEKLEIPG